ncbi:MAG: hypothetical protein ACR2KV_15230 [Solirubrobacteraceae bacterium]
MSTASWEFVSSSLQLLEAHSRSTISACSSQRAKGSVDLLSLR